MTEGVQVGRIYEGRVTSIKDFGAFVEILPGKDGLVHISELSDGYVSQRDRHLPGRRPDARQGDRGRRPGPRQALAQGGPGRAGRARRLRQAAPRPPGAGGGGGGGGGDRGGPPAAAAAAGRRRTRPAATAIGTATAAARRAARPGPDRVRSGPVVQLSVARRGRPGFPRSGIESAGADGELVCKPINATTAAANWYGRCRTRRPSDGPRTTDN